MILSDTEILPLLLNFLNEPRIIAERNGSPINLEQLNPASVDIRIGLKGIFETKGINNEGEMVEKELPRDGFWFWPGDFALVETMETFNLPHNLAMDLRLKSSMARLGWDHSLAFWVDPGWCGILTMEIRNCTKHSRLLLKPGQRFAQVIIHQLSSPATNPYSGRYQNAVNVERNKL